VVRAIAPTSSGSAQQGIAAAVGLQQLQRIPSQDQIPSDKVRERTTTETEEGASLERPLPLDGADEIILDCTFFITN